MEYAYPVHQHMSPVTHTRNTDFRHWVVFLKDVPIQGEPKTLQQNVDKIDSKFQSYVIWLGALCDGYRWF